MKLNEFKIGDTFWFNSKDGLKPYRSQFLHLDLDSSQLKHTRVMCDPDEQSREGWSRSPINLQMDFPSLNLPFIIWVPMSISFLTGTSPRVEVQPIEEPSLNHSYFIVTLEESPSLYAVVGKPVPIADEDLNRILKFISLVKDSILQYWNGQVSSIELYNSIKLTI